jgi:hypothetical protein
MSNTTALNVSSQSQKLTRYQLPGFGLPLNFKPNNGYTSYEWDGDTREHKRVFHPGQGDCGELYPNALDGEANQ